MRELYERVCDAFIPSRDEMRSRGSQRRPSGVASMLQLVLFVGADGRWLVPMALVQSVQMVTMESELAEMALVQMESVVAGCCRGSQWRWR